MFLDNLETPKEDSDGGGGNIILYRGEHKGLEDKKRSNCQWQHYKGKNLDKKQTYAQIWPPPLQFLPPNINLYEE